MRSTHPDAPVVALDIDGTLGQYHEHFRWFAELYTGKELPPDWRPEFKGSFNRALHMGKPLYREVKLAYRQSGMKRCMPTFMGAGPMTKAIRKSGAEVWICTTRPYLRLDNVDPDTRHFLRRRGIQYDAVLYGPYKYRDLVKRVGVERVVLVIDDLPEQIASARQVGLPALLRSGPHNEWAWGQEDLLVKNMYQACQEILTRMEERK